MRGKVLFICGSVFTAMLLISLSAVAQEELPPGIPSVENQQDPNQLNINQDKALLYEPARVTRDSVVVNNTPRTSQGQSTKPRTTGKQTKEEEDALSFNFLYYIIQKFKFSDIIDQ